MDSSKHHDPYFADSDVEWKEDMRFRDERWTRAGASPEEVAVLGAEWEQMTDNEQALEGTNIDSVSDSSLSEELDRRREGDLKLAEGSVQTVMDNVGDDAIKAQAALTAEQAKPKPRASLISKLEAIISTRTDTVASGLGTAMTPPGSPSTTATTPGAPGTV